MEEFGIKKAIKEIAEGNTVKMISTDFKTHLFYKSNKPYIDKPIVHHIKRNIGNIISLNMTYDEFTEKFKDNKFRIYN